MGIHFREGGSSKAFAHLQQLPNKSTHPTDNQYYEDRSDNVGGRSMQPTHMNVEFHPMGSHYHEDTSKTRSDHTEQPRGKTMHSKDTHVREETLNNQSFLHEQHFYKSSHSIGNHPRKRPPELPSHQPGPHHCSAFVLYYPWLRIIFPGS
jgi:hypothetical protein